MKSLSSPKPVWVVVEPFFYIHSVGYLKTILQDERTRKIFDIVFIYGEAAPECDDLVNELHEAYDDSFSYEKVELGQSYAVGSIRSALARNWKVMRVANGIAAKQDVEVVSLLRVDDFIRLLAIPGMSNFFPNIRGRVTGVFFNSRCFREKSIALDLLAGAVSRVLQSAFFTKVLFLDHGVCGTVRAGLSDPVKNTVGEAIDPWTSGPEIEYQGQTKDECRTTLLTFGAHSGRKGTLYLLRMFRDYPEELSDYKLLIAGPIRDDIKEEFEVLMTEVDNSSGKIECVDKYISDSDSWCYFLRSQIVLCPYVNFHGSSNTIIRAAAVGIPVVAPSFGFLGEVVEQNKIGVTYKTQEPAAILEALFEVEKLLAENAPKIRRNCEKYAQRHRSSLYAESLLLPVTDRLLGDI